jgi:uncharacterized membrane protein
MAHRTDANKRSDRVYNRRRKVLQFARNLARSGSHADHSTILPCMESQEGFAETRAQLEDRSFKAQLDRLCALARGQAI